MNPRYWARTALAAVVLFFILLAGLHFIEPEFDHYCVTSWWTTAAESSTPCSSTVRCMAGRHRVSVRLSWRRWFTEAAASHWLADSTTTQCLTPPTSPRLRRATRRSRPI